MPRLRSLLLALTLPALLLGGCGRPSEPRSGPPPAAFHPERFPDVPLPPGYVPIAGQDQLAVSYAGGALRRYHAVLHLVVEDGLEGAELGDWYRLRLQARGWELAEDAWPRRQRWTKTSEAGASEQLLLETGRADRRAIIRLVLTPAGG